jgi:hypothetical protein
MLKRKIGPRLAEEVPESKAPMSPPTIIRSRPIRTPAEFLETLSDAGLCRRIRTPAENRNTSLMVIQLERRRLFMPKVAAAPNRLALTMPALPNERKTSSRTNDAAAAATENWAIYAGRRETTRPQQTLAAKAAMISPLSCSEGARSPRSSLKG